MPEKKRRPLNGSKESVKIVDVSCFHYYYCYYYTMAVPFSFLVLANFSPHNIGISCCLSSGILLLFSSSKLVSCVLASFFLRTE